MSAGADTPRLETPFTRPAVARALAGVVFGASLVQTLSEPLAAWTVPERWPRAGVLSQVAFMAILTAGLALQSCGIVLARRAPAAGLVLAFAAYAALMFGLDAPTWLAAASLPVAVIVFVVAFGGSHTRTATVVAATLSAFCAMHWAWMELVARLPTQQQGPYMLRVFMSFAPLVLAGAVVGGLWGGEARRAAAARREAEAARREHQDRIARAKDTERARIAQELHDVAAQHLAGLLSLADAAVDLADVDPTTAVGLIGDVRAEGRFAVASLYGALGELRAPDATHNSPTPDAHQVDELLAQWRARGMAVELLALGDVSNLPAVLSVTAYRTVQESLANAAKHAPGAPVRVRLLVDVERVGVVVENAAPTRPIPSPGDGIGLGWGLSGLRDRLTLLDGTLQAGPTPGGGWRVAADVPLPHPETTGHRPQLAP